MSGPTIAPDDLGPAELPTETDLPTDADVTDPVGRPPAAFNLTRASILPRISVKDGGVDLRAPEILRFQTEATIGEGGNGVVVRAVDADLGRRVAIKRLRHEPEGPGDVARFVREVRLMGSLEHPNIVPLYDVGRGDDGAYYAVMKWVDGETLEELLARLRGGDREAHATWNFDARMRLFMELCRGVVHANERGILHRDIKPGNIMVARDGSVQILDWGLAKAVGEPDFMGRPRRGPKPPTLAAGLLGTPAYMAPEQARGEPYTHRTEVFALGAVFWELLTLRTLWTPDRTVDEMVAHAEARDLSAPFQVPPHPSQGPVPSHLSWFVWRCTRPDPFERFADVEELVEELHKRASGEFPVEGPTTFQRYLLVQATRLLDRHPTVFPVVVASSTLSVLCLVFTLGLLVGAL